MSTLSSERGFSRKSYAPSFMAWTAVSMLLWPEIIIIETSLSLDRICLSVSMPSISGIHISRSMMSGLCFKNILRPFSPEEAVITS